MFSKNKFLIVVLVLILLLLLAGLTYILIFWNSANINNHNLNEQYERGPPESSHNYNNVGFSFLEKGDESKVIEIEETQEQINFNELIPEANPVLANKEYIIFLRPMGEEDYGEFTMGDVWGYNYKTKERINIFTRSDNNTNPLLVVLEKDQNKVLIVTKKEMFLYEISGDEARQIINLELSNDFNRAEYLQALVTGDQSVLVSIFNYEIGNIKHTTSQVVYEKSDLVHCGGYNVVAGSQAKQIEDKKNSMCNYRLEFDTETGKYSEFLDEV